jgi:hypothetical protein
VSAYGLLITRLVAFPLRWQQYYGQGCEKLGNFKLLWGEELRVLVCSLVDRIQNSGDPPLAHDLLIFLHRFLVFIFSSKNLSLKNSIGTVLEQMIVLFMIHSTKGWKSASYMISLILSPFKNIARAVLINSAFLNGFEEPYIPLNGIDILPSWGVGGVDNISDEDEELGDSDIGDDGGEVEDNEDDADDLDDGSLSADDEDEVYGFKDDEDPNGGK